MLRWLIAKFAWVPVYFSAEIEVEINRVSALYRHRSVKIVGDSYEVGEWVDGMPDQAKYRVDLDDLHPPEEMARRLVPLWGPDDRRKADNDR